VQQACTVLLNLRSSNSLSMLAHAFAAAAAAAVRVVLQVVEEGYEFFAKRQLVTIFSAPNYCGEFENAGAMMSVDETLMCSFQVRGWAGLVECGACMLLFMLVQQC
jgi:hypothetical protein